MDSKERAKMIRRASRSLILSAKLRPVREPRLKNKYTRKQKHKGKKTDG